MGYVEARLYSLHIIHRSLTRFQGQSNHPRHSGHPTIQRQYYVHTRIQQLAAISSIQS